MRNVVAVGLAVGLAVFGAARAAGACGGCFQMQPTPTTVSQVTYHRMALSVAATQTTLWDQFGYAGRPDEFSWILPIRNGPDVRVELADVRFLAALDDLSAVQVPPPPPAPSRSCPYCYTPPPAEVHVCGAWGGASADASASFDAFSPSPEAGAADGGVTVLRMESVGPYELTVLRGSDAGALRAWLNTHRYVVPADLEPTLSFYTDQHMDFVALRLSDGAGVGQMQPVRVTVPGYQPGLPLRMVAAGVGDSVELVLMVVSATRMESVNFPATALASDGLAWDYASPAADSMGAFRRAERELSRAAGDRAWLTESAVPNDAGSLSAQASAALTRWVAASDAGNAVEDMTIALTGVGERPYVTRLHANLPKGMLDRDLTLGPSTLGAQPREYRYGRLSNTPTPAACEALTCASGIIAGGEGEIYDPLGEGNYLAPSAVFPAEYRPRTLPAFRSRYSGGPRYASDGNAFTPTPTRYIDDCADAGRSDASRDGALDAGRSDAGSDGGSDAGSPGSYDARGGCDVRSPGRARLGAGGLFAALLAAGVLRRRRDARA